jgi:protein-S-isoprenylcysteine O-methyltransferase Ste14
MVNVDLTRLWRRGTLRSVSIAGYVLMASAALMLFYTDSLFSNSPFVTGVQAAALGLMLWARIIFGRRSFHTAADPTGGGLVTSGPYRFIRHPIYTAASLFCGAGIVANASEISIVAGVLLSMGVLVRIRAEEKLLVERYPEYRKYAHITKRMVPFVF